MRGYKYAFESIKSVVDDDGFIKEMMDAKIFVFDMPSTMPKRDSGLSKKMSDLKSLPNLPFPVCWFEAIDGISEVKGMISEYEKRIRKESKMPEDAMVLGVTIIEKDPERWLASFVVGDYDESTHLYVFAQEITLKDFHDNVESAAVLMLFFTMLDEAKIGSCKTSERVKAKISGEKVLRKIKDFFVIKNKKSTSITIGGIEEDIDWSHRWTVRSHWRKVRGLGRDRSGNFIKGFTWVRDFIKGPEHKPLVQKTRVL